jgi:hypothetical protein
MMHDGQSNTHANPYVRDLQGAVTVLERKLAEAEAEVKRLAGELFDLSGRLRDEAGKAEYAAREATEPSCHHPYWKQLPGGKEVCQRCGADVSHMDGMGG